MHGPVGADGYGRRAVTVGPWAPKRIPACLPAWASPNHDHWCESSREERDHNASLAFLGLGEPYQGRPWLTTPPPRPLDWRDDYSCVHTDAMLPSRPAETSFMPTREQQVLDIRWQPRSRVAGAERT